jgi:hypothetical protein
MLKTFQKPFSVDMNTGETKWRMNSDLGWKIAHCVSGGWHFITEPWSLFFFLGIILLVLKRKAKYLFYVFE